MPLPRCCRCKSQRRYCVQRRYQRLFRCICLAVRLGCLEPPGTIDYRFYPTTTEARYSCIRPRQQCCLASCDNPSRLPWYIRYSRSRGANKRGYGFYLCNRCYIKQSKFWSATQSFVGATVTTATHPAAAADAAYHDRGGMMEARRSPRGQFSHAKKISKCFEHEDVLL